MQGGSGSNTDPALSLVPGSDTWLSKYRLSTPSGAQAFLDNYASLVVNTSDLASIRLNGSAVNTSSFTGIAGTNYSRGIVDLPLGLFDLTANSEFLVMLAGGSEADSYFTYGGSSFAPGISPPPPPPPLPPPSNDVPLPSGLLLVALGLVALARSNQARKA